MERVGIEVVPTGWGTFIVFVDGAGVREFDSDDLAWTHAYELTSDLINDGDLECINS